MITQEDEDIFLSSPLTREDMIHELVQNDYNSITSNSESNDSWIWDTIQYGWIGYQNLSDADLQKHYDEMIEQNKLRYA